MLGNLKTGKLDHIGVVVRDLESTIQFYELLGAGPFERMGTPARDKQLHGRPLVGGCTQMVMGRLGRIGLQLTMPIEPPSMSYEFLQEVGEGINHVAYEVKDICSTSRALVKAGYSIIFSSEYIGGGGEVYVDTGNNFCIQLFQPSLEQK